MNKFLVIFLVILVVEITACTLLKYYLEGTDLIGKRKCSFY